MRRFTKEVITESESKVLIGEGLIKTVNPKRFVDVLEKWNKNIKIKYHNDGENLGFVSIFFLERRKELVDKINKLMNNYGYFPSTWFDINNNRMGNYLEGVDYEKLRNIHYEPKFDIEYIPQSRYMYHITDEKYLDKIKKIGLIPKTNSKIGYHPERIYLAKSINDAKNISDLMGNFIAKENQVFLKIDLQNLIAFFMQDGQFYGGVYTMNNIPPSHIEIIN